MEEKEEKKNVTIRLPIDLYAKVQKLAKADHRTFSGYIELCLLEALEEKLEKVQDGCTRFS